MNQKPLTLAENGWNQQNNGDLLGSIFGSRNINFEAPKLLKLSKRMRYLLQTSTSPGYDQLLSIVYGSFGATTASSGGALTGYHLVTESTIFATTNDFSYVEVLSNASTPTVGADQDCVSWNGGLWVSTASNSTKLCSLIAGTWTTNIGDAWTNVSVAHPLCASSINNYLLAGDGNLLRQRTTGGVSSLALTLPAQYQIKWIRSSNKRTYIGTATTDSSNAKVFYWDETPSSGATDSYEVNCNFILSGEFHDNDFYILTNDGRLMIFDGGGFDAVAYLPVFNTVGNQLITENQQWIGVAQSGDVKPVSQRGMRLINDKLHINLIGSVGTPALDGSGGRYYNYFPSGIWVYSEDVGLYHKYGLSNSATDGDFCQFRMTDCPGAISPLFQPTTSTPTIPTSSLGGTLLAGAYVATTGFNVPKNELLSVTTGENRGYIETVKIESSEIANNNVKIWCKYYGVFGDDDKILFKYRDEEKENYPLYIGATAVTWSSGTTFTSTNTDWQYAEVGELVTVLSGNGSGAMAHISSISYSNPTYTIVLDETIPGVSSTNSGNVSVDNYKRIETSITSADTDGYKEIVINQGTPSTFIQIMVELRGESTVTVEELKLITQPQVLPTA